MAQIKTWKIIFQFRENVFLNRIFTYRVIGSRTRTTGHTLYIMFFSSINSMAGVSYFSRVFFFNFTTQYQNDDSDARAHGRIYIPCFWVKLFKSGYQDVYTRLRVVTLVVYCRVRRSSFFQQ